jgi:O-antigen/teichoic acid export membrane protein
MALHTFVWLYFFNLLPSLVRTVDQPQERLQALMGRSLNLTAWTGCAVALALTLGGGRLMSLAYGPEFTAAATPLAILAWILPVALVSGHYRYVLIAYGAQRLEFACSAAAAVTAVAGGLALIPKYEAAGAATALLLASLVNLAYAFVLARYRVLARTDAAPCLDKNG